MKKLQVGAQYLLGLIFFVFGLNGFLGFLPMPPMPEAAGAFMGGLAGAGYFFPFLKAFEVLCGLALLTNRFVPLALLILSPIVVNILLFHVFLAPAGGAVGYLAFVLVVVNLFAYKGHFNSTLVAKAVRDE
ncbi:hypothetical protein N9W79_02615 [bacterium]|nr:hypothetical protein [bacterium]